MHPKDEATVAEHKPFTARESWYYYLGQDEITLHMDDDPQNGIRWQLEVNGDKSPVAADYREILVHRGYGVVTEYFEGTRDTYLVPWVPFKITTCELRRSC